MKSVAVLITALSSAVAFTPSPSNHASVQLSETKVRSMHDDVTDHLSRKDWLLYFISKVMDFIFLRSRRITKKRKLTKTFRIYLIQIINLGRSWHFSIQTQSNCGILRPTPTRWWCILGPKPRIHRWMASPSWDQAWPCCHVCIRWIHCAI